MSSFLLRVEGVNFDATVYETNDISTIRGASLALLGLGDHVLEMLKALPSVQNPELVFNGASQAVLTGDTSLGTEALRQQVVKTLASVASPPFSALTTVVDVVEYAEKDEVQATLQAEARNAARQFRQWTIEPQPFSDKTRWADKDDRVRPALVEDGINAQRYRKKAFGRDARQDFYEQELQGGIPSGTVLKFTNSLQDMVDNPPPEAPENLHNKMAVFYADGNSFGTHRKDDPVGFSNDLKQKRRALLKRIIKWYSDNGANAAFFNFAKGTDKEKEEEEGFRLETLLWGGDEMLFVMPGWLAWLFVKQVADEINDWSFHDKPLTHAMGLVIADRKTPIRQLRAIAQWNADGAKDAGLRDRNTLTIEIFESLSPPERIEDFHTMRAQRYGQSDQMPRWLALPTDQLTAETGNLPRSQLYKTLRSTGGSLIDEKAVEAVGASLAEYERRTSDSRPALFLPAVDDTRPLPLTLAMLADLWDYLPPAAVKEADQ